MKKTVFILLCALFAFTSCEMFRIDNMDAPEETIRGKVIDVATGNPVLTDQGSEGIRVRLHELSWKGGYKEGSGQFDFYCRPDGTFQNTKIFKGNYKIEVDGPFIPLVRKTSDGTPIADGSQTMDIKGVTEVTFEVQPFLNVRFVGEPQVSGGVITAQVIVERAVSPEEFEEKIAPMGNWDPGFLNVTDVQLFVTSSPSPGYASRDERWTNSITFEGDSCPLGTPITITSNPANPIPSGSVPFIRAAARINFDTPRGTSTRRYNYSEELDLMIP